MPETPVAPDVHQALDIHGDLRAESPFNLEVLLDLTAERTGVFVGQFVDPKGRVESRGLYDLSRTSATHAVEVGQRDLDPLVSREVNPRDTCHGSCGLLALTLLMPGIPAADDAHHTLPADDPAVFTHRLYAATDLHGRASPPFVAELGIITNEVNRW
jgi:hypothetical protein